MATEDAVERTVEERLHDLETRLQRRVGALEELTLRLRSANRRLAWALAASLAVTLIGVVTAIELPLRGGAVRASRFVLEGRHGERGALEVGPDGSARLVLLDGTGTPRLRLVAHETGSAGLMLLAGRGEARLALGLLPDESGSLVLADRAGAARAVLGVSAGGIANLVFADGNGAARAAIGVDGAGAASLELPEPAAPADSAGEMVDVTDTTAAGVPPRAAPPAPPRAERQGGQGR